MCVCVAGFLFLFVGSGVDFGVRWNTQRGMSCLLCENPKKAFQASNIAPFDVNSARCVRKKMTQLCVHSNEVGCGEGLTSGLIGCLAVPMGFCPASTLALPSFTTSATPPLVPFR